MNKIIKNLFPLSLFIISAVVPIHHADASLLSIKNFNSLGNESSLIGLNYSASSSVSFVTPTDIFVSGNQGLPNSKEELKTKCITACQQKGGTDSDCNKMCTISRCGCRDTDNNGTIEATCEAGQFGPECLGIGSCNINMCDDPALLKSLGSGTALSTLVAKYYTGSVSAMAVNTPIGLANKLSSILSISKDCLADDCRLTLNSKTTIIINIATIQVNQGNATIVKLDKNIEIKPTQNYSVTFKNGVSNYIQINAVDGNNSIDPTGVSDSILTAECNCSGKNLIGNEISSITAEQSSSLNNSAFQYTIGDKMILLDTKSVNVDRDNIIPDTNNNPEINSGAFQDRSSLLGTMVNPLINLSKNDDGSYSGEWFVNDAPPGPLTIKIIDKNGIEVYSRDTIKLKGRGILFENFKIGADAINSEQEYTFVITGGNGEETGKYEFSGEILTKGAAIVDSVITTQYNPQNSYLININGIVSSDQKTLSIDFNIGINGGLTLANNMKALIVKNQAGAVIKTIKGEELLKYLGGAPLNISVGLESGKNFTVELESSDGIIEAFAISAADSGFIDVTKTIQGASGYGSVYNPIVTYGSSGGPQGYSFSIHAQAASASSAQVIDAATGKVINTYNSDEFYISGSQNTYKQGYSYYIVYYDQLGNVATTQKFTVTDKSGRIAIQTINEPPTFYEACSGQYAMALDGHIESISVDGKTYAITSEEVKKIIDMSLLSTGRIVFTKESSASLENVVVTYIDSLGVKQTATFNTAGGNINMTSFSGDLVQLKPIVDEQIGETITLNNGVGINYYSNDQTGTYYAQITDPSNLKIVSMSFGYTPYDNDLQYQAAIIAEFKKTGKLPDGVQFVFEDTNGGTFNLLTSYEGGLIGDSPLAVIGDTTTLPVKKEITVDAVTGTITIPRNDDGTYTMEPNVNPTIDNPIVQEMIDDLADDPYCQTHTCGSSLDGVTVEINPTTSQIIISGEPSSPVETSVIPPLEQEDDTIIPPKTTIPKRGTILSE